MTKQWRSSSSLPCSRSPPRPPSPPRTSLLPQRLLETNTRLPPAPLGGLRAFAAVLHATTPWTRRVHRRARCTMISPGGHSKLNSPATRIPSAPHTTRIRCRLHLPPYADSGADLGTTRLPISVPAGDTAKTREGPERLPTENINLPTSPPPSRRPPQHTTTTTAQRQHGPRECARHGAGTPSIDDAGVERRACRARAREREAPPASSTAAARHGQSNSNPARTASASRSPDLREASRGTVCGPTCLEVVGATMNE